MRMAASCGQPLQVSAVPRGARTGRRRLRHPSAPVDRLDRRDEHARRDHLDGRIELGREPAVRPGTGHDAARSAPSAAAVGAPGCSGARSSMPRAAAHQLDGEHTESRFATTARSLRAAAHPIDTWSSCIAEVGIDVDARRRREAAVLVDQCGRGVLGDHQARVDARLVGQERRQAVRPRRVEQAVDASLGHRAEVGEQRSRGSPQRGPSGAPWKLPFDVTRPSESTTGLSIAERSSRGHDSLDVRQRVPHGAVHLRSAAQRVRVLHAGVAHAM